MSDLKIANLDTLVSGFKWEKIDDRSVTGSFWSLADAAAKMGFALFDKILRSMTKNCEFYLSDICYEIKGFEDRCRAFDEAMNDLETQEEKEAFCSTEHAIALFGIRKCGVDGNTFVHSRVTNGDLKEYKDLFYISFVRRAEGYYDHDYIFNLYRMT